MLALLLAAIMLLSLAACGGGADNGTNPGGSAADPSANEGRTVIYYQASYVTAQVQNAYKIVQSLSLQSDGEAIVAVMIIAIIGADIEEIADRQLRRGHILGFCQSLQSLGEIIVLNVIGNLLVSFFQCKAGCLIQIVSFGVRRNLQLGVASVGSREATQFRSRIAGGAGNECAGSGEGGQAQRNGHHQSETKSYDFFHD